jgi:hypothetical protein
MPALVAGIHVFLSLIAVSKTWMAGTKPGHDVESPSALAGAAAIGTCRIHSNG